MNNMKSSTSGAKRKRGQSESGASPRQPSRQPILLDAAARLFSQRGFEGTSMRDLANAVGMLHGSIYYHFPSKEELFVKVYREGKRRNDEVFAKALEGLTDPWARLEAVCIAHVNASLQQSDYALVLREQVIPENAKLREQLVEMRDAHEALFRELIDGLPLSNGVNRKYVRLVLLGALMHTHVWYRAGGDSPRTIVHHFLKILGKPEPA